MDVAASKNLINSTLPLNLKKNNSFLIKNTYKLLYYFFKSMYSLISKPVIKYTNNKIIIQLFYFLNIPKKKIFRLFSIIQVLYFLLKTFTLHFMGWGNVVRSHF